MYKFFSKLIDSLSPVRRPFKRFPLFHDPLKQHKSNHPDRFMKKILLMTLPVLLAMTFQISAQNSGGPNGARPRVVVTTTPGIVGEPQTVAVSESLRGSLPATVPGDLVDVITNPTRTPVTTPPPSLSFAQIRSRLDEARREMRGRPMLTALADRPTQTSYVQVAFLDSNTGELDYAVILKDQYLRRGVEHRLITRSNRTVILRNVRPNGVNTPLIITDESGRSHLPLMAEYPVEREGRFYEMSYYISTHPGIVTAETVAAGKNYIRNTIESARFELQSKGFVISPLAVDMAERLCVVEHVDHLRFRTEPHENIYNDIFTLYALNEGQTYRYSVSSAGAGGMIQMIPSTYRLMRNRFPGAGLVPDFVDGMRNHANAAKAMLLYIQLTHDDLMRSSVISDAVRNGTASIHELLSAGYNSNPARLAGYIRRGGQGWRTLIPRETQIYLQINASMDVHVPIQARLD